MPLFDSKNVEVEGGKLERKCTFRVPTHLEFVKRLGVGVYGSVAAFDDTILGRKVAVKKIAHAFDDEIDGKRILREVKLLRQLDHPNVLRILDMLPPASPDFEDIYIVTEFMDTDLQRVITSKQKLTEEHHAFLMYQLLRGLVHLHSAHVVHRDLKPANLLVSADCKLKICDFGLSRVLAAGDEGQTDYVVTRWYRAPELVLSPSAYTDSIDIWAAGCIHTELILRTPLFKGKSYNDQVRKIVGVLGTPHDDELLWLPPACAARDFLKTFPATPKVCWSFILPSASDRALQVVEAMVRFDPNARLSAQDALRFDYFEALFHEDDLVADRAISPADWSFDDFQPTRALLQNYVYCECASFHPEILERDQAAILERSQIAFAPSQQPIQKCDQYIQGRCLASP